MKMLAALITTALFFIAHSETHITGDISAMTLDISGNPYIVEQDIMIPEGKKVVIKEGCVFLFKPFTGFTIHGQIIVEGTQENPVVFSSINDGDLNPNSEQLANPFDWNGILVLRESNTASFNNIALRYSVYGIKSQNQNIQITNGLFRQNGQFHFTINDKIQFVQDNIPYSFNGAVDTKDINISDPPPDIATNSTKKKLVVRYVSLGVGVAGTVAGLGFGLLIPNTHKNWNLKKNDPELWNKYEREFWTEVIGASACGVIGVTGLTIFGLTFRK